MKGGEEKRMNGKAVLVSAIAILGTAWLLWAGYRGMGTEPRNHEDTGEAEGIEEEPLPREHDQVRALKQRGDILSLERILQGARSLHAGRVLESELKQEDGRYFYEVELVDDRGRVWEMSFDAKTGENLREGQGD
jgi:uncharacterized membrane protein YkoI